MEIQIIAKNVYGSALLYPDCETSKILCSLTRKKTFDISDLLAIKKLGYQIRIGGHVEPALIAALI